MGATYPTLLFADNTMLMTQTAIQIKKLLGLVIEHCQPFNPQLYKDKCQLQVTDDVGCQVTFPDGIPAKKHTSIKYLGATFSQTENYASAIMRRLRPLWSDNHITISWKLVVYNAVKTLKGLLHTRNFGTH